MLFWACESGPTYDTTDLLPEGAFTAGMEGPSVDAAGNVYAVNYQEQGTIGVVSPEGEASLLVNLPDSSTGNGIRIGADGTLYVADYVGHHILKIDPDTREVSKWIHGPEFHQPNDLAMAPNGQLYASDPDWANSAGQLWMVDTADSLVLLETGMGTTNGLEVSPDGKRFYVNEAAQQRIWVYDRNSDGTLENKQLFHQFEGFELDGMRCDTQGNLYVARYGSGTVVIFSPEGEILRTVRLKGEKPTNLTFGGPEGKTVYVTLADRGCFELFEAEYPGRAWAERR
ncbi:MAG TPA: gluconolactonase [Cytophagales bacterium]|nr:gluconolactonase [Cytophagales bacterium]